MNQPAQQQEPPGRTGAMSPRPDHGEESYRGSGRLAGKAAVITGADTTSWRTSATRSGTGPSRSTSARSSTRPRPRCRTCGPGASIIGTSSVDSDAPAPRLLPYDVTKAGVANMTAALAQLLAGRGIRASSVAPGPVWTPLI